MRLTKLDHACVRLEKDGATLVIDPGAWSGPDALAGAQAVLITHEHPDHLDAEAVRAALAASSDLQVWANPAITAQLAEAGGSRVHEVTHGDVFDAAGFSVHVYGREHARILPEVPVIANTGFAVDGEVFHPGDSFTVPEDHVRTLLLPVSAPWMKFAEAAAYAREVAPRRGYAIHDAILSPQGAGLITMLLGVASQDISAELSRLEPGTSVEL
jgi:L-ascorbate metabolism protein UlaG (beta-lactamase superfamily)